MTLREAASWLGVPDDRQDQLELLLLVPHFRRAVSYVTREEHLVVWDEPRPRDVRRRFDLAENRNGDLDIEWLTDLALKCRPPA